jgi:glycosyltransferase involved in cell wall biosynthesis
MLRVKHIVLMLYAGDFLEAARRRAAGLPDQYRHHTYATSALSRIRSSGSRVTVIQRQSASPYKHDHDGIRFLGLGGASDEQAAATIEEYLRCEAVSHVALCFPSEAILSQVLASRAHICALLADSFPFRYRHFFRYRRLGRLLRESQVEFVANHHINSSRQVVNVLGVPPEKVVPWDWPLDLLDLAKTSAKLRPTNGALTLCYVGMISEAKGVWDLLQAVGLLRREGQEVFLELAGEGDRQEMWSLVQRYGLQHHFRYHGSLGGSEVIGMMQRSSFVCIPSHHAYPEGLPLTLYEAMASGTPIIASNHPMFRGVVRDGMDGFVFRAGSPAQMASTIRRAWGDVGAYRRVSSNAAAKYPRLGLSTLWGDILERWVRGTPDDFQYLSENSLGGHR